MKPIIGPILGHIIGLILSLSADGEVATRHTNPWCHQELAVHVAHPARLCCCQYYFGLIDVHMTSTRTQEQGCLRKPDCSANPPIFT